MFYRIKENKICDYADYQYAEDCKETSIITQAELDAHPNKVIIQDDILVLNPNYEKEEEEKEKERVNNLTMTPLDFIKVLEQFGLTLAQINSFLESNLNIKMQLTYCNSVYCGVVKSFLPIEIDGITITAQMVEAAFKAKEV
jgi:hypothetical protein